MSTAVTPEVVEKPQPQAVNLLEKAVCISVSRKLIGYTRTVSTMEAKVGVKTDQSMVHVTKELFDSKELQAIISADGKIDGYLKRRCLPSPLKRSVYLLPNNLIPEVDAILTEHSNKRQELIGDFCKVYEQTIAEAKERLGELFNPADYLPLNEVTLAFAFNWQYLNFGAADALKGISQAMYQREQKKIEAQMVQASEAIQQMLRVNMASLVNHMVDRLTPKDGKKMVFRKSMMDNIKDFLKTFDELNLSDDKELKKLVEKAQALTEGISPENLKTDEAIRDSMQAGFTAIKTQLDSMLTEVPTRSIRFD